jgi:hypothetical protein
MEADHPAKIDYGPPCLWKGLAASRWPPLDLQKDRRRVSSWAVIMLWLIAFPIICAAGFIFMRRFERHLEKLTGPWISD